MSAVLAMPLEDVLLLQKDDQLYQAWALSQDYYFGTVAKQNRIKALAWQGVYLDFLPASYPQKKQLLAFYERSLNPIQLKKAVRMKTRLKHQHDLETPLSEAQLTRIHFLRENNVEDSSPSGKASRALAHNKQTGLIGRVLPWRGCEQGTVLLRAEPTQRLRGISPRNIPYIPLTVTPTGVFYTTGLAEGRYGLYISTAGLTTRLLFRVKMGEVKALALIDLRKKLSE